MNIIFGTDQAEKLRDRFTLLELDTFKFGNGVPTTTAYCVIESIPLDMMPLIESWKQLHEILIKNYQCRNWTYCIALIEELKGAWNCEMDSFYEEFHQRISKLLLDWPGEEWSPIIERPMGSSF